MKKNIFLGQVREILTIAGALCFATFEGWPGVTGLLVAIAAVGWALIHHEEGEIVFTSIRKALALFPGVAVYCGWLDGGQAAQVGAIIIPLMAMFWSWRSNGGTLPPPPVQVLLLAGVFSLLFNSCAGMPPISFEASYTSPETGITYSGERNADGSYRISADK